MYVVFLNLAVSHQDLDDVRYLLNCDNYDVNTTNEDGLSPIHQCAIDNSKDLLEFLIKCGGNINMKDQDRWTPLHAAGTSTYILHFDRVTMIDCHQDSYLMDFVDE
jgi:ankyrin repeat protein